MATTIQQNAKARPLNLKAAVWAGIIAGAVFLVMEMVLVATIGGGSLWGPPRMMAAIVMGKDVLPPPATFALNIVIVAMIVHFALSIIYGFILGWLIRKMSMGRAIGAGVVFGLVIYFINFYGIAPVIFPWFEMAQNWITFISHVVFGAVLGWAYKGIELQSWKHHP